MEENTMLVEFDMSEKTWNLVVVDGSEHMLVESEGMDTFRVEYASVDELHSALNRFDGVVDYRIQ